VSQMLYNARMDGDMMTIPGGFLFPQDVDCVDELAWPRGHSRSYCLS
jgi:hypothetical protein